jgi:hypothetical protein
MSCGKRADTSAFPPGSGAGRVHSAQRGVAAGKTVGAIDIEIAILGDPQSAVEFTVATAGSGASWQRTGAIARPTGDIVACSGYSAMSGTSIQKDRRMILRALGT